MSQTRKFKADKKYGQQAERLTASRLCSRFGVARNDPRLIAESSQTQQWPVDSRGRLLVPVEWEWPDGSYLRSSLLDAKHEPETDLICVPMENGGFIELPTQALARLVRRGHREAKRDALSSFELLLTIDGDSQRSDLAIPVSELLAMTAKTGLENTLGMLESRVREANAGLDRATPCLSRPTMTALPADAWHTLPLSFPMATRPETAISKTFDLFVITELDDAGAIRSTIDAEVKADRRFFETSNVFVELRHKSRPSGIMATTAKVFVLVFGGVSVTLPSAWLRPRVQAILDATGPERMRTNASDDGLVEGILLHPKELLFADLNLSASVAISKSRPGNPPSQRSSARHCEPVPF